MAFAPTLQEDPSASYLSDDAIKRKRALADALIQQGSDTSAIRSPWQGVARLAQGLMGGLHEGMANAAEKENNDYNSTLMNKVFGTPRLAPETGSGPTGDVAPGVGGFNGAVNRTLQFEGGLLPKDTNGTPSNMGINQAANPDVNIANLSKNDAINLYKNRYWDTINGDALAAKNPALAHVAFDTAVIAGPGKAQELIQQSGGDPLKLLELRQQFQNSLIKANPQKYGQFAKSWDNRIAGLRHDIGGGQGSTVASNDPVQVASNSPSQAFLLSREARKQDQQPQTAQTQIAQAQPSRAQQILAAMSDPRITPQNRQILTQLYTDAVKNEERYAAPYMDDYGNLVQKDPSGKINVLHASPEERDTRTPEQKNYEYLSAHPEAKEYFEQTKQFKPGRHVVGGALIDDNGNEIYKAKGVGPSLTPEAIKFGGQQLARGDKSVLANLGRGAQGAENVTALRNEAVNYALAHNIDPRKAMDAAAEYMGQQAGERTLGTQEANAMTAGTEASNALLIGRGANAALPRGNFVPVNQAIQAWQGGNSDPRLAKFGQAMATIANTYARAVNPKGLPHEAVVSDTLKRLSSAQGPEALNAILDVMQQEIDLAEKSPNQAREIIKENRAMRNGDKPEKPSAGVTSSGLKWSIE